MHDALAMRLLQRLRDLPCHLGRLPPGQPAAPQPFLERLALDQLQDQVRRTVDDLEAVDGGDVRVVHGGEHAGLALEPPQCGRVGAEGLGQRLDRHLAPQHRIVGSVDVPHAAPAQKAPHLKAAQARPG